MTGKVYAVASGKGGVGKTTTVVNLGVTLRADEHSVALVDADLGMANLGTFLGIDHEPTLHDVLAGEASIDDALVEQVEGFGILPGARDLRQYAAADPRKLEPVLEELSDRFEYVLVDTGAGVGFEDVLPLELVDEVLLVASPDRAALGDAGKTAEVSELLGVTVRGVVFTMADESDDVSAIADEMGVEHLATVPEDPSVPESTASGRPLEAFAPDSAAAEGYRELAAALTGRDVEQYEPDEAPVTNDGPAEPNAERSGETDDGAAAEPDAAPDTTAESPDVADSPDGNPEATEPTPDETSDTDEVDVATAEAASDTAGDEGSIVDSTEDDGESDTEAAEVEAGDGSPVGSDDGSTGSDSQAGDEPGDGESTSDGDTEAPNTESTSRDTEAEESGSASTDDERESEKSERKSGGLLSRLGGLFG